MPNTQRLLWQGFGGFEDAALEAGVLLKGDIQKGVEEAVVQAVVALDGRQYVVVRIGRREQSDEDGDDPLVFATVRRGLEQADQAERSAAIALHGGKAHGACAVEVQISEALHGRQEYIIE